MNINKLDPKKICRTCLCESPQMRSLRAIIKGKNRTLMGMLSFVANINILLENQLPDQICYKCESILYTADAFKSRVLKSEEILSQQFGCNDAEEVSIISDEDEDQETIKTYETDIDDVSVPKHRSKSNNNVNSVVPEGLSVKLVTQKENHVIINKNDSNEITQPLDALIIEYNEGSNTGSKDFTCKCGIVCENKDEYILHSFTSCLRPEHSNKSKRDGTSKSEHDYNKSVNDDDNDVEKSILLVVSEEEFKPVKKRKPSTFECVICSIKFTKKTEYINHMKIHEVKTTANFTCNICERKFHLKTDLEKHSREFHAIDKGYSCTVCLRSFKCAVNLKKHRKSHNRQMKHQCYVCKKEYKVMNSLRSHIYKSHVSIGKNLLECSICSKTFKKYQHLNEHVRRHKGIKPYKCNECGSRFVSTSELKEHYLMHTTERNYTCEECGYRCRYADSLRKHKRKHTGERPYACDQCPKRFTVLTVLKNHKLIHTGEKAYKCPHCDSAFALRHNLVEHIRIHTGEKPYTCDKCGQAFRILGTKKRHMRMCNYYREPKRDIASVWIPKDTPADLCTAFEKNKK